MLDKPAMNHISIWLMPEIGEREKWKQKIIELSKKYSGPVFEPHVTLFSGEFSKDLNLESHLSKIFEKHPTFALRCDGLHFSERFSKSCYIQFQEHEKLIQYSRKISSVAKSTYDFNPHMSLFYGSLSDSQRQLIRNDIKIPDKIQFSNIWTVDTPPPTQTSADVRAWKKKWGSDPVCP